MINTNNDAMSQAPLASAAGDRRALVQRWRDALLPSCARQHGNRDSRLVALGTYAVLLQRHLTNICGVSRARSGVPLTLRSRTTVCMGSKHRTGSLLISAVPLTLQASPDLATHVGVAQLQATLSASSRLPSIAGVMSGLPMILAIALLTVGVCSAQPTGESA